VGKDSAEHRLSSVPSHLHTFRVVGEVVQIEPTLILLRPGYPTNLFGKARLAVGGEPHHLVFVPVFWEAEELRKCGIENAQRMREGNRPSDFYSIPSSYTPHHTAEIAEAVDGDDGGLLKRRREECAGEMRPMMFHKMDVTTLLGHDSLCSKFPADLHNSRAVRGARREAGPPVWPQGSPHEFICQMSPGIARDCNVVR